MPLPEILAIDTDRKIYILEDLGKASLLNNLEAKGLCDEVFDLYKKSLKRLPECRFWVPKTWILNVPSPPRGVWKAGHFERPAVF
ncbi:MAG: hypothetical protein IPH28_07645 [Cytophagaceae bacterium]|nr:hypothetical protein [Cytophagaceae bacterium]